MHMPSAGRGEGSWSPLVSMKAKVVWAFGNKLAFYYKIKCVHIHFVKWNATTSY